MAQPPPKREQSLVDHRPDPVMSEVESFLNPAQHMAAHELLDARRRRVLIDPGRLPEQREVEFSLYHCGQRGELTRGPAQTFESTGDQLAYPLRQGRCSGIWRNGALLERAGGL